MPLHGALPADPHRAGPLGPAGRRDGDGFDLVFRVGAPGDAAFIARPMATSVPVFCASPRYLQRHGTMGAGGSGPAPLPGLHPWLSQPNLAGEFSLDQLHLWDSPSSATMVAPSMAALHHAGIVLQTARPAEGGASQRRPGGDPSHAPRLPLRPVNLLYPAWEPMPCACGCSSTISASIAASWISQPESLLPAPGALCADRHNLPRLPQALAGAVVAGPVQQPDAVRPDPEVLHQVGGGTAIRDAAIGQRGKNGRCAGETAAAPARSGTAPHRPSERVLCQIPTSRSSALVKRASKVACSWLENSSGKPGEQRLHPGLSGGELAGGHEGTAPPRSGRRKTAPAGPPSAVSSNPSESLAWRRLYERTATITSILINSSPIPEIIPAKRRTQTRGTHRAALTRPGADPCFT